MQTRRGFFGRSGLTFFASAGAAVLGLRVEKDRLIADVKDGSRALASINEPRHVQAALSAEEFAERYWNVPHGDSDLRIGDPVHERKK